MKKEIYMRIIAGEFKGRRLESPEDDKIRPTTDKVKEAMFSICLLYTSDVQEALSY